jgi:hypothetical protein
MIASAGGLSFNNDSAVVLPSDLGSQEPELAGIVDYTS